MTSLTLSQFETSQNNNTRRLVESDEPTVLSDIYQDDCNIAVWRRELTSELQNSVTAFLATNSSFQVSMTLSSQNAFTAIHKALGGSEITSLLCEDIAELIEMFGCLFDLGNVGLRLAVLDKAMCPKFHVDHVPCRLVTTYQGAATQWLPHHVIDRTKLGRGSEGKPDEKSGLFSNPDDIRQLGPGDVALLKGSNWEGNEQAGLVHRSPALSEGERRLFLSLDFS